VQFPKVQFLISVADASQFPPDHGREVAFAGRSNAGKSSAINSIVARNALARTSKTPGRTKLLNFFELDEDQRIIDLPGYGYARASPVERKQWTKLIDSLPGRSCIVGLFLIVDIRRGVSESDEQLIEWAAAAGWQVHMLLAKSDKLNQRERAAELKLAKTSLKPGMTAQVFSAHEGEGVPAAQKRLVAMLNGEGTSTGGDAGDAPSTE
jgi:GTP-binding protein